jgi:hypothetical protein
MLGKIGSWLALNGIATLGIIQGILKLLKELLTAILDLISLFLPQSAIQKIVDKVRGVINAIDRIIETIKIAATGSHK